MFGRSDDDPLKVFEPKDPHEALQGWALHVTRRRKIHELHARRLDRLRYVLGIAATCLSAVAGTSAFAAWLNNSSSSASAIATGVIGVGAALLGSMITFLDLGARAEANRQAAIHYKTLIREFEAARARSAPPDASSSEQLMTTLLPLLADADRNAPTVPQGLAEKVERAPFCFVVTADELNSGPA